ncbi:hypothetical protein HYC85_007431 [Camellia sinensis]|uniref:BRCC36 C-terminal helical domain-containing protein n=1 Tax=Camellia sinensis TaxID=4442 RepID=A0A7J7HPT3_CAMSI|nr:hypothetical protein HYC85_007431 [Camellia sinensis]
MIYWTLGFNGDVQDVEFKHAHKVGRIQVIAFQSLDGKQNHILRAVPLSPVNRSAVIDIESSLSSSENASTRSGSARAESLEQDTGDSRATAGVFKNAIVPSLGGGRSSEFRGLFVNADASYPGRERMGGNLDTNNLENAIVDIDPMDMSESMQEAMHRSNLDMSGAEFVRKEIPLYVLPTLSLLKLDCPMASFTDLQHVLYEEERTAYNQSILQNMSLSPAINTLQDRLRENEIRLAMLNDEAKILETEASKCSKSSSGSPRNVQSHGLRGSASFGHRDLYGHTESHNLRKVVGPGSRSRKGS